MTLSHTEAGGFTPMSAPKLKPSTRFKAPVVIDTYKVHKTLFDIAKDEVVASAVLE